MTSASPLLAPAPGRAGKPSLKTRLRVGFAAIAAALALLAVAAVVSLDRLGGAVATILRENYDSTVLCEQMKEALERQDSAALFAATGRRDIAAPMLAKNREGFARALRAEDANVTVPGEGELVREIHGRYEAYLRAVDRALSLPEEEQQAAYFGELLPAFTALKDRVESVLRLNQATMEAADRDAKRLARRTVDGALGVSLGAVLFVVWFAYRLPRAIMRPLDALTRSATAVGEGRLDVTLEEPETAELALLAAAFTLMTQRLRVYRDCSLGELLAAKDLARSTLEGMVDPVLVLDADGGVLLANEAAERTFALRTGSAEELCEAAVAVPEALAVARDRALGSGAPVLPKSLSEAVRHRVEGVDRHYLLRALPLAAPPGGRPSALVVAQDVTRLHRIDELKNDMVATVSHEFKTPLTSLRMATHLLLEANTGPLNEAQHELVTTARDDTERLRAMVEELLDVVRIEAEAGALHRVAIQPRVLLGEVAEAHRAIARDKGVTIEVEAPAELEPAHVDAERLSIALANLVANAVRHTAPGGHVRLRAAAAGRGLRLEVADDGEGIGPESLPRIFERAFSAATEGGGERRHGLGLTIAREIVLQHGGEIRVASDRGMGTTFSLVLPADAAS
jgi:signal transduction histidine kinase